jgi:hypothetical protein
MREFPESENPSQKEAKCGVRGGVVSKIPKIPLFTSHTLFKTPGLNPSHKVEEMLKLMGV